MQKALVLLFRWWSAHLWMFPAITMKWKVS